MENDGPAAESFVEFLAVEQICRDSAATKIRIAQDATERAIIWRGRKAAFAAVGRISPDYIVQDGVVPRTRLGEILQRIADMADEAGLRVANVFHAGTATCIHSSSTARPRASCTARKSYPARLQNFALR